LLADRLSQAIVRAPWSSHPVAVVFADLDHLKHINESLEHAIGDQVLISVARRLVNSAHASGMVARPNGADFVVLPPQAGGVEGVCASSAASRKRHSARISGYESVGKARW
jgi:diguanylate cyclase (GGDEF)-like protein